MSNICMFIDSVFINVGVDVILNILSSQFFVEKTYLTQIVVQSSVSVKTCQAGVYE